MGTPAWTDCASIIFDTFESAEAAYPLLSAWVEKANNRGFEKDSDDDGDYGIELRELDDREIHFYASSMREQNMQWQAERILNFAKTLTGVVEINIPIAVQGDGEYWSKADEENNEAFY